MAGYAGDVPPQAAWDALTENSAAVLIDVRTDAEWNFVGIPDLSPLGRRVLLIEWQSYPSMAANPDFVAQVARAGVAKDQPVYLLCRSGARSRSAAMALTEAGYAACFNVSEGFEGNPDSSRHRGTVSGWKARGLPWQQQ